MPCLPLASVALESTLLTVLVQLAVIMVTARLFAALFRRFQQPAVVGEIAAGLLLGPSFFGRFFPTTFQLIFDPDVAEILGILSQFGLILLLFLVGLEFDFGHLRWHSTAALAISVTGVVVPFALGVGVAQLLYPTLKESVPYLGFLLFMGIALSITAIPVLGRIMLELGIARTRVGTVTMAAAAVDDALGWILLATVASLVQSQFVLGEAVQRVAAVCGFVAAMHYVVRPWLRRSLASLPKGSPQAPSWDRLGLVLLAVFLSAMITSLLGVFAILGAFVCGTILSEEEELRQELRQQLRPLVMIVFVPIFFTYTGLQTDLGSLESWPEWLWFGGILLVAIAGKWAGCGVAAWLGGFPKREAACIGVLMNARGLMELVVINVGRDVGVIVPSVYCMLVLMALITTLMATPLVIRLMPGTELESPIRASGFMSGGRFVRDAAAHPLEQES